MANLLIVTEKPSVAKSIARALGVKENGKHDGYIEGFADYFGYTVWVTWCLGHLVQMSYPEAYDPKYAKWKLEDLPLLPEEFMYEVIPEKKKQFQIVTKLMNSVGKTEKDKKEKSTLSNTEKFLVPVEYVVNACDAGREGELIFNRMYELSGSRLPVKRLWISSMEDDAILNGFMSLKDASEYRNLAEASVCRAQADWLVGINASRAFTKIYDHRLSVGRVQTPTLALLVERGEQIDHFQKTQYFVTHLLVESRGKTIDAVSEHFADKKEADRLADTCNGCTAALSAIERDVKTAAPPKLYDLTSMQRDANRLLGFTASRTLDCAQTLYEKKLITYPRTDSRYLTDDMEQTVLNVLGASGKVFPFLFPQNAACTTSEALASRTDFSPKTESLAPDIRRILDSSKVSDHHAIIPTAMIGRADLSVCSGDERKILTLIAVRLACATGRKYVYETVKATLQCGGYSFSAYGRNIMEQGWKETESAMRANLHLRAESLGQSPASEKEGATEAPRIQDLSSLYEGAQFPEAKTNVTDHWTKPPAPFTEDSLLAVMERSGADEMDADVERKGLGTPATRAGIIEKLISSKYAVRRNRQLIATETGKQLVSVLPEYLRSAKMTADWENRLLQIEQGKYDGSTFMDGITQMISRMLQECRQIDEKERQRFGSEGKASGHSSRTDLGKCPVCGSPVYEGKRSFYCSNRECRFVLWKDNKFLERMRKSLNEGMVRDILSSGRTFVKNLYSIKKDKFFSAYLCMEWKDGKSRFTLDFTE